MTQKILVTVGVVDRDKPKSEMTSMARKQYMGLWRLGSIMMTEDCAVPHKGCNVKASEEDGEPDMSSLQKWDVHQDKCRTAGVGAVE